MSLPELLSRRPNPCASVRIPPLDAFGLNLGEGRVIRNAGAAVTDADLTSELCSETGQEPSWRTYMFDDPADHVRQGLARPRSNPFLHPDIEIRRFVLDVKSGSVEEVTTDRPAPVS